MAESRSPLQIGEDLRKWALDELGLSPTKVPSTKVLASICRGSLAPLWLHLINTVASSGRAKDLRSVQLGSGVPQVSKSRLSELKKVEKGIQERRREVSLLRNETLKLSRSLSSSQASFAASRRSVRNSKQRSSIIELYSKKVEVLSQSTRQYTKLVTERVENSFRAKQKSGSDRNVRVAYGSNLASTPSQAAVFSTIDHNERHIRKSVESHLDAKVGGPVHSISGIARVEEQDQSMRNCAPEQVIDAISRSCQQATTDVRKRIEEGPDTEVNSVQELPSAATKEETLRALFDSQRRYHLKLHLARERLRQEAGRINPMTKEALAGQVFTARRLEARKAYLKSLKMEVRSLTEEVERELRAVNDVETRRQEVDKLQDRLVRLRQAYSLLIRQNMRLETDIRAAKENLNDFALVKLPKAGAMITENVSNLRANIGVESLRVNKLVLPVGSRRLCSVPSPMETSLSNALDCSLLTGKVGTLLAARALDLQYSAALTASSLRQYAGDEQRRLGSQLASLQLSFNKASTNEVPPFGSSSVDWTESLRKDVTRTLEQICHEAKTIRDRLALDSSQKCMDSLYPVAVKLFRDWNGQEFGCFADDTDIAQEGKGYAWIRAEYLRLVNVLRD